MAVGYGYVRSEEPTIVDWGAITKQATDSLAALDADRKKRRADIEETSREYYKELANKPVSQNTAFNTFMSDYSSQASKAMLAITNQLKTGEISEEEFYRKRGNISSQTQIMLSNFKTYAENYDKAIQRAGAGGLGSAQEAYEKGLGQQFTNFENLRPIIDPNSYEVMFARESVGPDGKSRVEMASANDVFQFSNFTRDKFDLDGAIQARLKNIGITSYKNKFGEVVTGQYIGKGGEVLTDAIKKDARGIVSQDETVISILTDYGVETTYDFAMLPDDVNNTTSVTERDSKIKKLQEQNPDLIYRDSNGKYYVSDSQRESAAIFVEEQLTNAASYTKEEAPYMAKKLIDLDIEWREATIGKVEKEAAQLGQASKVPALKAYTKRFFDFTKKDEEGNIIPGEIVDNIEDVLIQGLGKFNFRQISYDDKNEQLTFYPVQGGKPFVLDLKIEGKSPDELSEDLTLIVLANRGLPAVIQQAIIDGALTDETVTGEKPSVNYPDL